MRVPREEIFRPVVALIKVNSFEEAIAPSRSAICLNSNFTQCTYLLVRMTNLSE
ncbi:hypothetical protein SD81_006225 [Tolypothrix campylonemoides VB511288]|nr:hypothetical protein SD81_006225 [Tolypothrix campylonemoides VB511288]